MEQPRQLKQQRGPTSTSAAIAGQTVADVLACWPQTVTVFVQYRLACVGCPISRFELIGDVAAIYGINPGRFLQDLQQVVGDSPKGSNPREREA